jgi:hypothetical protein
MNPGDKALYPEFVGLKAKKSYAHAVNLFRPILS